MSQAERLKISAAGRLYHMKELEMKQHQQEGNVFCQMQNKHIESILINIIRIMYN
jgi:hypothetical protein